jgi:type III restriction enzyme
LESYSSDAGINVMIINVQAFNATGKDNRRIYEELDAFQSRRPIDVIAANRPILILDEPQKMEGKKSLESFRAFNALAALRYSATHRTTHNKVHRLDALDAYNQKLVKRINVRGITVKGQTGTSGFLYLQEIRTFGSKRPQAQVELEVRRKTGIKRELRIIEFGDNLFDRSNQLDQYRGFVVSDIDARDGSLHFSNGLVLTAGEAIGDVNEAMLRRIQIRETIKAHLERERSLHAQGIKVLSLFFIDEVAKYRDYDQDDDKGDYARIFEEEYALQREAFRELGLGETTAAWQRYLDGIEPARTHSGYFSIDKRSKKLIDPSVRARGEEAGLSDDVDAYDLILKDKERLLSLEEPVRFIFSHSALREGWDNPNVFVICTLKHSDNTVSRRQEVGRGLRLAVNRFGDRMDDPATVHGINVLTVVANESYAEFVAGLQKDISAGLADRPRLATAAYFEGKVLLAETGEQPVTPQMAKQIYRYLAKNDYTDDNDRVTEAYHVARREGTLAELPEELQAHADAVYTLIDSVFSEAQLPVPTDGRRSHSDRLNANFARREFQALWSKINRKAVYTVHFDSTQLVSRCVATLNRELKVQPLQYRIIEGAQREQMDPDQLKRGSGFEINDSHIDEHWGSAHSAVPYDLVGKLAVGTVLTRATIASILTAIEKPVFAQFAANPESFLTEATRLILEQKATAVVEHLSYSMLDERWDSDLFTLTQSYGTISEVIGPLQRHIYDYVSTNSQLESRFVRELDSANEVVVYAKLPRGFLIPTPVGNYNPDWAIAFQEGKLKHIYFVAETKGTLSTMHLRKVEDAKLDCARRFFRDLNRDLAPECVRYEVVDSFARLTEVMVG